MTDQIKPQLEAILGAVSNLRKLHPTKAFTIDGRLLGDLGEVLVADKYGIRLNDGVEPHHDGVDSAGRRVQIKTTMKGSLTYPADHCPDFVIGFVLKEDATIEEVFNGPGRIIGDYIASHRSAPKNNLHNVSLGILRRLSEDVRDEDRIPEVPEAGTS